MFLNFVWYVLAWKTKGTPLEYVGTLTFREQLLLRIYSFYMRIFDFGCRYIFECGCFVLIVTILKACDGGEACGQIALERQLSKLCDGEFLHQFFDIIGVVDKTVTLFEKFPKIVKKL